MNKKLLFSFFIAFFVLIANHASAQCSYVSASENNESSVVQLPCDFPVINFEKATDPEKAAFNQEVSAWKLNHPGFESLSFHPEIQKGFILISADSFAAYDQKRKDIVSSFPTFYIVTK